MFNEPLKYGRKTMLNKLTASNLRVNNLITLFSDMCQHLLKYRICCSYIYFVFPFFLNLTLYFPLKSRKISILFYFTVINCKFLNWFSMYGCLLWFFLNGVVWNFSFDLKNRIIKNNWRHQVILMYFIILFFILYNIFHLYRLLTFDLIWM